MYSHLHLGCGQQNVHPEKEKVEIIKCWQDWPEKGKKDKEGNWRAAVIPVLALIFIACGQPIDKKDHPSTDGVKASRMLSVREVRADLTILYDAIKEMHPAYGIYTSADSLQTLYDQINASLDSPISESDLITHIYPLLCALRCGHTQIRHSKDYAPSSGDLPHLPFEVLVKKHHVWVTTHTIPAINTGDEILAVNDIPVASIVDHGYNLYAGDGYNETFKELYLSEYDGFEDVFNQYYHWKPPYSIMLREKKGGVKTILVNAATKDPVPASDTATTANYSNWMEAKGTDYLPLRFLKHSSVAWFQVKSYQYGDTVIFKEAFKQIQEKGIKSLIIDLRHNTGGDIRIAANLLSYLADAPYHIIGDVRSRIPNPAFNSFSKYFDAGTTVSFTEGFSPGSKEGSYYHVTFKPVFGDMLGTLPLNTSLHFNGDLYVLIDGATFSSGAHTAIAIRTQCKKARFIGRETAGGAEGCSGGTIQHLTLPNTGIVIEFPWMRIVSVAPHQPVPGRGIIPEFTVEYTAADVVNKNDLDLEKALRLIKQRRPGFDPHKLQAITYL